MCGVPTYLSRYSIHPPAFLQKFETALIGFYNLHTPTWAGEPCFHFFANRLDVANMHAMALSTSSTHTDDEFSKKTNIACAYIDTPGN